MGNGEAYIRGGGGLISRIKKPFQNEPRQCLIEICLFKLKSQNKATFSLIQYCHPAEGGLYPGELITGCIFCFQVDGPITGRAYKRGGGGGGGSYNRNFTVCM